MTEVTAEASPHPVDIHVGRRVSERRRSLGHNQTDLGQALGITFQQVQKYERGTNRISASKLWEAARFLGVDIAYFFEGLAGAGGDDGAGGAGREPEPTRASRDIADLSRRLSVRQQRNVLAIVEDLAAAAAGHAGDR